MPKITHHQLALCCSWLIVCALMLIIGYFGFNQSLWGDEDFTFFIINGSWSHLWSVVTTDFHPPGFYILLKIYAAATAVFWPLLTKVTLAKIFVFLPHAFLAIGGLFYCQRHRHLASGLIFAVGILTWPLLLPYSVEIRMYSLVLLGVTTAGLAAAHFYRARSRAALIVLAAATLLTFYSQYYAGVSVMIIWAGLWWHLRRGHAPADLRRLYRAGALVLLFYLPRLPFLPRQLTMVADHPLGQATFALTPAHAWHFLASSVTPLGSAPAVSSSAFDFSLSHCALLLIFWAGGVYLLPPRHRRLAICAIFPYLATLFLGFVLVLFDIPFSPRYLYPTFGGLIIALSLVFAQPLTNLPRLKQIALIGYAAAFFAVCSLNLYNFCRTELAYARTTALWQAIIHDINTAPAQTVIVYDYPYACYQNRESYFPGVDALDCLPYISQNFGTPFAAALHRAKKLYVLAYYGDCTGQKQIFTDNGFTLQEIFRSPLLDQLSDSTDQLQTLHMVSPQCVFYQEATGSSFFSD